MTFEELDFRRTPMGELILRRCTEFLMSSLFTDGEVALAKSSALDPRDAARRFDAVLLDIDHSLRHVLHPSHAELYTVGGLRRLAAQLRTGGVFALWSNDPPDAEFRAALAQAFARAEARVVSFPNPLHGGESSNTAYLARR